MSSQSSTFQVDKYDPPIIRTMILPTRTVDIVHKYHAVNGGNMDQGMRQSFLACHDNDLLDTFIMLLLLSFVMPNCLYLLHLFLHI